MITDRVRASIKALQSKYLGAGAAMSRRDEASLSLLRDKERKLNTHAQQLHSAGKGIAPRRFPPRVRVRCVRQALTARTSLLSRSLVPGCNRLSGCLRPFFFLFGFFFFIVTVVLLVSMVLTNIDKLLNSECGFSCGYVLTNPKRWNPLDALLVVISKALLPPPPPSVPPTLSSTMEARLADPRAACVVWCVCVCVCVCVACCVAIMQYFPMDYIVVGLVVMYIFFTTLSGVTSIGIRALWILLYRIKARATRPRVTQLPPPPLLLLVDLPCHLCESGSHANPYTRCLLFRFRSFSLACVFCP
jgi:LMBR1 domain-containing protein 1